MLIKEYVVQNHVHEPYLTKQPCLCNSCSIFTKQLECDRDKNGVKDWFTEPVWCCMTCPSTKKCSKLDEGICKLDDDGKSFVSAEWSKSAPFVECTLDSSMIKTADQLMAYQRKIGKTKSFNKLATNFCSETTNSCMNGLTNCSQFTSTGKGGTFCRQWLSEMTSKEQDVILIDHCINHDTSDCACILRSRDPEFLKLKSTIPINDNCWWRPCFDNTAYLVPHEIRRQMCPNNVCNSFIKTDRIGQNDTISDNIINCGKISVFNLPKRLVFFIYVSVFIIIMIIILKRVIRNLRQK